MVSKVLEKAHPGAGGARLPTTQAKETLNTAAMEPAGGLGNRRERRRGWDRGGPATCRRLRVPTRALAGVYIPAASAAVPVENSGVRTTGAIYRAASG